MSGVCDFGRRWAKTRYVWPASERAGGFVRDTTDVHLGPLVDGDESRGVSTDRVGGKMGDGQIIANQAFTTPFGTTFPPRYMFIDRKSVV